MVDGAENLDCEFCQIIAGKAYGEIVYQDEDVVAFKDINSMAPIHLLVVPREHFPSLQEVPEERGPLMGRLFIVAAELARKIGLDRSGYRLVLNTGRESGQSIFHLHLHLLGGRRMRWPPG